MKWGAWSVVFTGLSLTSVMAVVLFVLVWINPKDAAYGSMPLMYAAGSAVAALAFNRASAWAARRASRPLEAPSQSTSARPGGPG